MNISNSVLGNTLDKQAYGNSTQAAPGVVEMTSRAREAFEVLSQYLGDLISKTGPLIEPYAEPVCSDGARSSSCEAPAIAGLRVLVERIEEKASEIRRLTDALRV